MRFRTRNLLFAIAAFAIIALAPSRASAQYYPLQGWCETGNTPVITSGLKSTTLVQASYPQCTVNVYVHGGGVATIYSTSTGTPLANPTTGSTNGYWEFYVAPGAYDVALSGGLPAPGFPSTVTLSDLRAIAPGGGGTTITLETNGTLNGSQTLLNLISGSGITVTDGGTGGVTIAATNSGSVTSVALAAPTGFNVTGSPVTSNGTLTLAMPTSWTTGDLLVGNGSNSVARLGIGTNTYILTSNGTTPAWTAPGVELKTCQIVIGDDSGSALTTGNIQPQRSQCYLPTLGTMVSAIVLVNSGASTVELGYRHNGSTTALTGVLTPSAVAGITDPVACANVGGTTINIEGNSVTCSSLSATSLVAGDYMETIGGAADGTSTRVSIALTFSVPATGGGGGGGGGGTVTTFTAGNLSPLFTTSVATASSTPALTFALSNAAAGTVFGNATGSAAGPTFTSTPVLGLPGTTLGTLSFAGNTSGTAIIESQAANGSPTLTLPTSTGTFAVTASLPIVLSATTGNLTCAACVQTGAGATLGAYLYNFSASSIKIPNSAGATTAASGELAEDTTAANYHVYNGADSIVGIFDATSIVNGDCVQITKTGSKVQLTDAGGACGMGSSSAFSALTNGTNTTAAMHVGTGASLDATGSGTIAATTSALATNMLFSGLTSATNTAAAMLVGAGASLGVASTGTITANRLTVGAGAVTTGNGQLTYDTTALNWHIYNAAADQLLGVWNDTPLTGDCVAVAVVAGSVSLTDAGAACGGIPSTGSTGIVVQVSPTSTVARSIAVSSPLTVTNASGTAGNPTVACATCSTNSNTETLTNKTLNQEGTGNVVTTVWSAYADAAACNVTTAAPDWDLLGATIPAANCLTGTNTQQGTLDYDDAQNEFGQFKFTLPTEWTGNIDILLYWTVTSGGGSNAVKWTVATACTSPAATFDTTFNAAQTITTSVAANNITTTSQQLALTTTSCSGGSIIHFKVGRDTTDTFTGTARMIGARVTGRRTGE